MASKNTDIIEQLADTIVANLTTPVAKRGKETAPNDRSFYATILGVNRKFTDDVSADDQTALIEKFALPETVEDGEKNYYIFKINGAYYCSKQNGDFKLYEKIMVYIPNGDWSNLYIDYPDAYSGGSGSGSTTSLPDYTVSPEVPGGDESADGDLWIVVNDDTLDEFTNITADSYIKMYRYGITEDDQILKWRQTKVALCKTSAEVDTITDEYWIQLGDDGTSFVKIYQWEINGSTTTFYEVYPNAERGDTPNLIINTKAPMKEGDYWVDIDDETNKNIEALNKYIFNEDTLQYEWEVVFNVSGGSGGVGENLAPYSNTAERFNDYDPITFENGQPTGGSVSSAPYDHLEGYRNYDTGTGTVSGGYVVGTGANHMSGQKNKITGGVGNTVSGTGNTVQGKNNIVGGGFNTVTDGSTNGTNIVGGYGNTLTNSEYSAVCGTGVTLSGCNGVIATGVIVQLSGAQRSVIAANYFKGSSVNESFVAGNTTGNNYISCSRSVVAGTDLQIYSSSNVLDIGESNIVSSAAHFGVIGSNNIVTNTGSYGGLCAGYQNVFAGTGHIGGVVLGAHGIIDPTHDYQLAVGCEQLNGNGFTIDSDGNVAAAGTITPGGADFAETYEWLDGNPLNEDRRGLLVTVEEKYIRTANSDDEYILGVVSSTPSVCGDTYDLFWKGKYKKDIFGKPILDEKGKMIISDEYNADLVYIPQSQRPEKDYVGTNGKLVVIDDGTCVVNKYCKPSLNGIGTYSDSKYDFRVIERLDKTHVRIIVK